jgi:regulator of protease activity HflC (stomatin/prohibitin superfamily)
MPVSGLVLFLVIVFASFLAMSIKVLNEYERGVVFRLGRVIGAKGPGLIILIPVLDRMQRVDLRTVTMDVPPQDIITNDNVTVKVNAVVYFRVVEPVKAVNEVENYLLATSKLAQTTLRSVVGQVELDQVLSGRDTINHRLQEILDLQTEPWGVKVANVEVKQVDLPIEMQRAMAKQAEAERERRAKVIAAEGEYQASIKLAEAAGVMEKRPMTLQLRYLQTLLELSSERTTHTFIPFPIDLVDSFKAIGEKLGKA